MDMPLISIILPIYNIQSYLPKCMQSLFSQTYKNLEFVMVDDGSTDESGKICDEYEKKDERIKVIHKENGGLSDARNVGISNAQGEYITCIDPDDYVDPDYVSYLYILIKKYKAKMSIAQHRVYYDNGTMRDNGKFGDELLSSEKCMERLLYHDVVDTSAWGKLYHRTLFNNVRYPKGKLFEDIGTTYKLIIQCENVAVGYESKYNYIFHNDSIVNGRFTPNKFDLIEMTDKMAANVGKVYPNLRRAIRRRQVYARLSTLNQMLNTSDFNKEKNEMINYVKNHRVEILKDRKAPKRDKIAVVLLSVSYPLYRFCWLQYQNYIMDGKKQ